MRGTSVTAPDVPGPETANPPPGRVISAAPPGCRTPGRPGSGSACTLPRPVLPGQLRHHLLVRAVEGLEDLGVGDGTAEAEGVPAVPADVGHHRGVVGVAGQPLVGLRAGAALQADRFRAD